jgi:hypothetical protein
VADTTGSVGGSDASNTSSSVVLYFETDDGYRSVPPPWFALVDPPHENMASTTHSQRRLLRSLPASIHTVKLGHMDNGAGQRRGGGGGIFCESSAEIDFSCSAMTLSR